MAIDLGVAAEFDANLVRNVGSGDGAKRLPGLAGFEFKIELQLVQAARHFLRLVQLGSFTRRALGFEDIDALERGGGFLDGLALRDQEIPGEPGPDFYDVGLGSEAGDFFGEDDFGRGHGGKGRMLVGKRVA